MSEKRPKVIIPDSQRAKPLTVTFDVSTETILRDAKNIIALEIARYSSKVNKNQFLTLQEARVVQGYIETLVKTQKEEREALESLNLANKSDAELIELVKKLTSGGTGT